MQLGITVSALLTRRRSEAASGTWLTWKTASVCLEKKALPFDPQVPGVQLLPSF